MVYKQRNCITKEFEKIISFPNIQGKVSKEVIKQWLSSTRMVLSLIPWRYFSGLFGNVPSLFVLR